MRQYAALQALSRERDETIRKANQAAWDDYYRKLHELLAREDDAWMTQTPSSSASPNT